MSLLDTINTYASELNASVSEKNGIFKFEFVVAERKAFLSKKKLQYIAKFRIVEESKEFKFTEMLMESGSGLSAGSDFDSGMSAGFGFKTETYNTFNVKREGTIEEQSNLFGKKYEYKFDYAATRKKFEEIVEGAGYEFKYQVTPIGL